MIDDKKIRLGELEFDCRIAGEPTNPLVILLHGFPESSYMWTELMTKLAASGYYCLAPDLRGYSRNACPKGVKHYTMAELSKDVIGLAEAVEAKKFHLIGHDWGAGIGWYTVDNYKEQILSWTAMSIPHNRAFGKALHIDPEQKKKSRYIGYFMLPFLPEMMIRRNDFKTFRRLWKHSPPEEVDHYLSIFRQKKCLTAALNYYRANLKKANRPKLGEISTPTLFIWGNRDLAIGRVAAEGNHQYMTGEYDYLEVDGGHWLVQSNYKEVEQAVLRHLSKSS